MVPIFPIIGLTKRVRGRLLMASTSEVYGGKSPKIAHWYSTLLQRTGTAHCYSALLPQNKINKRSSHKYKILLPQNNIKDHYTNTKYCYITTLLSTEGQHTGCHSMDIDNPQHLGIELWNNVQVHIECVQATTYLFPASRMHAEKHTTTTTVSLTPIIF